MNIVGCRAAVFRGEVNSLVEGLRRDTFRLYSYIRHSVDQTLLALGSRLRALIECEAKKLQWKAHAALRDAAGVVQVSFVGASEGVHRSLVLIVRHRRHDVSARPGSSTTYSVNCETRRDRTRAAYDSESASRANTS